MSGKTAALSLVLILALITHVVAHVATVIHIGKNRSWVRAVLAFLLPPLAPLWAWRLGKTRRLVHAWLGSLAAYAIAVGVSGWLAR
jgi:hypothetical protein